MATEENTSKESLAQSLMEQGRHAEAEVLLRSNLSQFLSNPHHDFNHPDVMRTKNNLAAALNSQHKDLDYAEALQSEVVAVDRELHGAEHPDTLISINNLAQIYSHQGRYEDAVVLQRETLQISAKICGAAHRDTLVVKGNLANTLAHQEQLTESEALQREVLDAFKDARWEGHEEDVDMSLHNLACVLSMTGRHNEVEGIYLDNLAREGLSTLAKITGLASLGNVLRDRGDYEQAEGMYKAALTLAEDILGLGDRKMQGIRRDLEEVRKHI